MKVDGDPIVPDASLVHVVESNVVAELVEDDATMHAAVRSQVMCVSTHVLVIPYMSVAAVVLVLEKLRNADYHLSTEFDKQD